MIIAYMILKGEFPITAQSNMCWNHEDCILKIFEGDQVNRCDSTDPFFKEFQEALKGIKGKFLENFKKIIEFGLDNLETEDAVFEYIYAEYICI
eukprot:GHVL01027361.1.p1 GENE.GHVL01027361.1~~GHVL01027361.1.p1  ORF type:complete len:110 (-),score=20.19 GHVL01027361.1:65-346(-)